MVGYTDLTNVAITMTQTAPAINIFLIVLVTVIAYPLYFRMNRRVVDL